MRRFTVEVRYREEVCSQGVATLLTLTFWWCRFFTSFLWIGLSKLRHEVDSGFKAWQLENKSNSVAEVVVQFVSLRRLWYQQEETGRWYQGLCWGFSCQKPCMWSDGIWWSSLEKMRNEAMEHYRQSSLHTMDCRLLALLFRLRFFRVLGGVRESYGPSAKGRVKMLTLQHEWYI